MTSKESRGDKSYEEVLESFPEIEGVRWVRNVNIKTGPNSSILLGGRVTTAVLRSGGHDTEYSVWGIHLATDDQLTFFSKADDEPVVVKMVDCRKGSKTQGNYLEVTTYPTADKRLVIPRGVAHIPTHTNGLMTLNTPDLYWDNRKRFLSLEIDVINVEKERDVKSFPVYEVCRYRMPDWAYPVALSVFKSKYDPKYQAPFVFDRKGKMVVLRKLAQDVDDEVNGISARPL